MVVHPLDTLIGFVRSARLHTLTDWVCRDYFKEPSRDFLPRRSETTLTDASRAGVW
jgi:hypothetical protein